MRKVEVVLAKLSNTTQKHIERLIEDYFVEEEGDGITSAKFSRTFTINNMSLAYVGTSYLVIKGDLDKDSDTSSVDIILTRIYENCNMLPTIVVSDKENNSFYEASSNGSIHTLVCGEYFSQESLRYFGVKHWLDYFKDNMAASSNWRYEYNRVADVFNNYGISDVELAAHWNNNDLDETLASIAKQLDDIPIKKKRLPALELFTEQDIVDLLFFADIEDLDDISEDVINMFLRAKHLHQRNLFKKKS